MSEEWGKLPVRRYVPENAKKVGRVGGFFVYEYEMGLVKRRFRYPLYDAFEKLPDGVDGDEAERVVDQWLIELQDQERDFVDLRIEAESILSGAGLLIERKVKVITGPPYGLQYHGYEPVELEGAEERVRFAVEVLDCIALLKDQSRALPQEFMLSAFVGKIAQIGHRLGELQILLGIESLKPVFERGAIHQAGGNTGNLTKQENASEDAKRYSTEWKRIKRERKGVYIAPVEIRKKIKEKFGVSIKTLGRRLDDEGNVIYKPRKDKR